MDLIGLRYFNVYGRRQDPNGAYAAVIPKFTMQLMAHESPVINGDGTNDLADRAQHFPREHAARLWSPRPGRESRIDDVDVDRDVHVVGAVQGLGYRVRDDRLRTALLDLAHVVPAHALRSHPLERLHGRPVSTQAHLDEVPAFDRARFDQPAHRRSVPAQDPPVLVGGVGGIGGIGGIGGVGGHAFDALLSR